jgi:hypothetical protein
VGRSRSSGRIGLPHFPTKGGDKNPESRLKLVVEDLVKVRSGGTANKVEVKSVKLSAEIIS